MPAECIIGPGWFEALPETLVERDLAVESAPSVPASEQVGVVRERTKQKGVGSRLHPLHSKRYKAGLMKRTRIICQM